MPASSANVFGSTQVLVQLGPSDKGFVAQIDLLTAVNLRRVGTPATASPSYGTCLGGPFGVPTFTILDRVVVQSVSICHFSDALRKMIGEIKAHAIFSVMEAS